MGNMLLESLYGSDYKLIKPIVLKFETCAEPSGWIVYDGDDLTYGTGATIATALADYRGSLIVELQTLQKDRESLAPNLQRELAILEQHIALKTPEEQDDGDVDCIGECCACDRAYCPVFDDRLDGANVIIDAETWAEMCKPMND